MDGIHLHKIIAVSDTAGVPGFELMFNSHDAALKVWTEFEESGDQFLDLRDDYDSIVHTRRSDWKFVLFQDVARSLGAGVELKLVEMQANIKGQKRAAALQAKLQDGPTIIPAVTLPAGMRQ